GDGINQLKPYHGVYIFMNNGKNEFTKQYFFPINGCIKAMANDFDKDGDLDIAAIGFFTDNAQPEEGFIFLENKGKLDFQPYSLPVDTKFNKATTMDIGDIDNDGKIDIILGHGFLGNKALDEKKPLFLVLKNKF
ncbi:MAG: FG-GAP repeat domain-containing protein, partial [Segetibacter sp.]